MFVLTDHLHYATETVDSSRSIADLPDYQVHSSLYSGHQWILPDLYKWLPVMFTYLVDSPGNCTTDTETCHCHNSIVWVCNNTEMCHCHNSIVWVCNMLVVGGQEGGGWRGTKLIL